MSFKPLTLDEFRQLKTNHESGDPLKDFYDDIEIDLVGRLIATIQRQLTEDLERST